MYKNQTWKNPDQPQRNQRRPQAGSQATEGSNEPQQGNQEPQEPQQATQPPQPQQGGNQAPRNPSQPQHPRPRRDQPPQRSQEQQGSQELPGNQEPQVTQSNSNHHRHRPPTRDRAPHVDQAPQVNQAQLTQDVSLPQRSEGTSRYVPPYMRHESTSRDQNETFQQRYVPPSMRHDRNTPRNPQGDQIPHMTFVRELPTLTRVASHTATPLPDVQYYSLGPLPEAVDRSRSMPDAKRVFAMVLYYPPTFLWNGTMQDGASDDWRRDSVLRVHAVITHKSGWSQLPGGTVPPGIEPLHQLNKEWQEEVDSTQSEYFSEDEFLGFCHDTRYYIKVLPLPPADAPRSIGTRQDVEIYANLRFPLYDIKIPDYQDPEGWPRYKKHRCWNAQSYQAVDDVIRRLFSLQG